MNSRNSRAQRSTSAPLAALLLTLSSTACARAEGAAPDFGAYWHQGKAEITSYSLEQARYGEIHPGHAVLIFVTEDFSRSKQVKLDAPSAAGADRIPVMKLNFTKKFNTGLYPYSMMTSVFSPLETGEQPRREEPRALKITTSSQEWCGHTFTQLNRTGSGYRVTELSYFESEGDRTLELPAAIPEDELWLRIRLDPASLPTGEVELIPGTMFQRLRHQPWKVQRATATLSESGGGLLTYRLDYPALSRTLSIRFTKDFPHVVEGWEETYTSGFGPGASQLTTRARRMERILNDYWSRHDLADAPLRRQLGLE